MFYVEYVGDVGMTDSCSYVNGFGTSRDIRLGMPHIGSVCVIDFFISWYRGVVMDVNEVKVITSFASVSTFSFPGIPV